MQICSTHPFFIVQWWTMTFTVLLPFYFWMHASGTTFFPSPKKENSIVEIQALYFFKAQKPLNSRWILFCYSNFKCGYYSFIIFLLNSFNKICGSCKSTGLKYRGPILRVTWSDLAPFVLRTFEFLHGFWSCWAKV